MVGSAGPEAGRDAVRCPVRGPAAVWHTAALLSGAAALCHQLLWVRRLGDLVGHGAPTVAVVLATFFLGLGLGARFAGDRAARLARPGLAYLSVELLLATQALVFLPLAGLVDDGLWAVITPDAAAWQRLGMAAAVAALTLLPACIALGATLPLLVTIAGGRVAGLYGSNTFGAAVGAALCGFVLLPQLGLASALRCAAFANIVAGVLVAVAARRAGSAGAATAPACVDETTGGATPPAALAPRLLAVAAATSGLVGIGCEIVWTRALSSRLSSTVYSFTILLSCYLAALGLGAWLVARYERWRPVTPRLAGWALSLAAVAVIASTAAIDAWGARLRLAAGPRLESVQWAELGTALLVLLPPCLVLGAVFPVLVRLRGRDPVGAALGRVQWANTAGVLLAAVLVGFVAIPWLGLTGTLLALAAVAAGLGLALLPPRGGRLAWSDHLLIAVLLAAVTGTLATDLRSGLRFDGETLIEHHEGRSASVAVIRDRGGDLALRVDQTYRLGGEQGRFPQHRQGLLPMLLHPRPRRVLSIGVGTGSSVGAAAAFGTPQVDAVDVLPEVFEVLHHFDDISVGFAARAAGSERIALRALDARAFVRAAARHGPGYDVVLGELFVPWRPGEAAMYTIEHFRAVREALAPGGLFVQWLPLYQLGTDDLRAVVATFLEVFPDAAALWLYFNARTPTLGLWGSATELDLAAAGAARRFPSDAGQRELLAGADLRGPADVAACWLTDAGGLRALAAGATVESALRPRSEFRAATQQTALGADLARRNLEALFAVARPLPPGWAARRGAEARHRAAELGLRGLAARIHHGDRRAALRDLLAAVDSDPACDWTAAELQREARGLLERGQLELAAQAAPVLAREPTQRWRSEVSAARMAERRGDFPAAREHAAEALSLRPDDPAVLALYTRLRRAATGR